MKAVILAAGMGSRLTSFTSNKPKSLLRISEKTVLEIMVSGILDCGIKEIIIVVGYLEKHIKNTMRKCFPKLNIHFVTNKKYKTTNAAFSLMLVKDFVKDSNFIKFDGDVVFDKKILKKLIQSKHENCLCIDKEIALGDEEIKVIIDNKNSVKKANKQVDPKIAMGESIGIEKIGRKTGKLLFQELEFMMKNKTHHQAYYEKAYERLIEKGTFFYALDITGLKWVEIDTKEDFLMAKNMMTKLQ